MMIEQSHLFRSCIIYICKILEIGTSFEDVYLSKYTKDNVFDGIKNLAEAARKLANMYENK